MVNLDPGISKVITDFPDTLCADAEFANDAACAMWRSISETPYERISDSDALLSRCARDYQCDPG